MVNRLHPERYSSRLRRRVLAVASGLALALSLGGSRSANAVLGSDLPLCGGMPSADTLPQQDFHDDTIVTADGEVSVDVAKASVVMVNDGTGFVAESLNGEKVIVTAAHVVIKESPIRIMTADGRLFTAVGGCVGDDTVGSYSHDVAIVRVDESEQLPPPLPIATDITMRAVAVNYQVLGTDTQDGTARHSIDDPAVIPVAWCRRDDGEMELLSGLGKDDSGETVVLPGASGGPLINSAGEVIGTTVAYSPYPLFLDEAQRVCGVDEEKAYYAYAADPVVIAALLGRN